MSDEEQSKELPGVPDTEPTMFTIMERLNGLDERLTNMQTAADQRHAELLKLFIGVRDEIAVLSEDSLQTRGGHRDLLKRIKDLESKAS